jgi:hypothetical protein
MSRRFCALVRDAVAVACLECTRERRPHSRLCPGIACA